MGDIRLIGFGLTEQMELIMLSLQNNELQLLPITLDLSIVEFHSFYWDSLKKIPPLDLKFGVNVNTSLQAIFNYHHPDRRQFHIYPERLASAGYADRENLPSSSPLGGELLSITERGYILPKIYSENPDEEIARIRHSWVICDGQLRSFFCGLDGVFTEQPLRDFPELHPEHREILAHFTHRNYNGDQIFRVGLGVIISKRHNQVLYYEGELIPVPPTTKLVAIDYFDANQTQARSKHIKTVQS